MCFCRTCKGAEPIFSGFEVLDSTTKLPNMSLRLLLKAEISSNNIFWFGKKKYFFFPNVRALGMDPLRGGGRLFLYAW